MSQDVLLVVVVLHQVVSVECALQTRVSFLAWDVIEREIAFQTRVFLAGVGRTVQIKDYLQSLVVVCHLSVS